MREIACTFKKCLSPTPLTQPRPKITSGQKEVRPCQESPAGPLTTPPIPFCTQQSRVPAKHQESRWFFPQCGLPNRVASK